MSQQARTLLILTGDHSADAHAAGVIAALRRIDPAWQITGVGGVAMAATGIDLIADHRHMGVIGIGGVLGAVPSHMRLGRMILDWARENRPTVAVLIDYGVFHLWLAPRLRKLGIRVIYFIPPQIWASRPWRVNRLRRAADEVLCILPFEQEYYRSRGIAASFVGNPLVSHLPPPMTKAQYALDHGLDPSRTLIGLFPGSRKLEINHLLAAQVAAAKLLEERHPGRYSFILSRARNLAGPFFDAALAGAGGGWLKVVDESHPLLSACDLAVVASGTITLEATLYRTPMLVMYRGPWYAYQLARLLITVSHIALPNNLAGRRVVPELWQGDVNGERIADEVEALLEPPRRAQMRQDLDALAGQFAETDSSTRVAEAIVRLGATALALSTSSNRLVP
jgi:lipid-A-disaccharide synthase